MEEMDKIAHVASLGQTTENTHASLSERLRQEIQEHEAKLDNGEICPSCGLEWEECPRDIQPRAIMMRRKTGYEVECCSNTARHLQGDENLRQKGIHADVVAGLMRLAAIPERFSNADFSNFKINPGNMAAAHTAIGIADSFEKVEAAGRGLTLVGPVGVGKTHLIVAIIKRLVLNGIPSRYLYAPDMIQAFRNQYSADYDYGMRVNRLAIADIVNTRVVAIDDIGVDKDTEWTISQYAQIFDGRYRAKRITIIGTNLGLVHLKDVVGERSMSRILESSYVVQIDGKDHRLNP